MTCFFNTYLKLFCIGKKTHKINFRYKYYMRYSMLKVHERYVPPFDYTKHSRFDTCSELNKYIQILFFL